MQSNGNGHSPKPVQPLVGIPSARDRSTRYFGLSIYIQNRMYVQGVTHAGGAPITIPLELEDETLRTIYDSLDAVFLPGGEDIDLPATTKNRTSCWGRWTKNATAPSFSWPAGRWPKTNRSWPSVAAPRS